MGTEWMIAIIIIGVLCLIALGKSVTRPFRWIGQLALQTVVGAVLLLLCNLVGEMAGFHLPLNPVTALLTGLLRLPGLAALLIIKTFLL
ncbi:pro-sigmaK processing inhibitor BofA family protein [Brevibacillus fulvus]|uniref:Inhibitor of the pro-sigma K processing machinery n=1 Tax=Brevibacillus fulvus TaxID=1125967 RepID=A0A938Y2S0_9BACL|nr:pro-sigmaK processing inhibitor BofA family protein [Brevibacillus fulvus]MBM7592078.1 inhibitor of the pro-sigma K processing machinery [Brevibacillus fulvus]